MLVLDEACLGERVHDVVHGRRRHAGLGEHGQPLLARPLPKDSLEDRLELASPLVAVGERRGVLPQLAPADRLAETLPELLFRAGDDDPPVRGLEVLERDDRRVRRVRPPRGDMIPRGRPGTDVHELV